jgi:hypothetical protein
VIATAAVAASAGFALPHLVRLQRATPSTAAVIWLSALSLRAFVVVLAAAWLVLFFPATHTYGALTHWCWHHLLSTTVNGHDVGHVATLLPVMVGVVSLLSLSAGTTRLARALGRLASQSRHGPGGSVVVGGRDVMVAVAGLRRPTVLVSAGAMLELDDEELDAALTHEHAHIARRHRYVLAYAELCHAFAQLVPGTRRALEELSFHLERDADRWALAHRVDRGALAAALAKAARRRHPRGFAMALGGARVQERVDEILGEPVRGARRYTPLAIVMATLALGVAFALPPIVVEGVTVVRNAPAVVDCDDHG